MSEMQMPDPPLVWAKSTMMEKKIQSLVDRLLLGPQVELGWKATAGQDFPTEDTRETVVFAAFFERGLGIPTSDFFRGLLNYYGVELVHLNPTSILDIALFIHLCEAYLGISPHFDLWHHLYWMKPITWSKKVPKVVGGVWFFAAAEGER